MKAQEIISSPTNTKLLSRSEAAQTLGISTRTLDALVASRRLGFVRFCRHYKFRPADLEMFIARNAFSPQIGSR